MTKTHRKYGERKGAFLAGLRCDHTKTEKVSTYDGHGGHEDDYEFIQVSALERISDKYWKCTECGKEISDDQL